MAISSKPTVTKTMFGIRRNSPVEVIIDGAHLYYVSRSLGFAVDFDKMRNILFEEYDCRRISYIMKVAYDNEGQIASPSVAVLLDWLRYNGFNTVLGEAKEVVDGAGRRVMRQNVDVAITCAMVKAASRVSDIILVAGGEDLSTVVHECMATERAPRVTLVSTKDSCSSELRGACDWFIELNDIKDRISRTPPREAASNVSEFVPQRGSQDEAVILQDRRDSTMGDRMRLHPKSVHTLS